MRRYHLLSYIAINYIIPSPAYSIYMYNNPPVGFLGRRYRIRPYADLLASFQYL